MSRGIPERVLIVDGYNVLNARRQVLGQDALADAREKLLRELEDYAGFSGQKIVLVFDAWKGDRKSRTSEQHGNVEVVYTQKGETADNYIERLCDDYASDMEYRRKEVRVATSDALEQTVILGRGATRISARELLGEMQRLHASGVGSHSAGPVMHRNMVEDRIPRHILDRLREMAKEEPRPEKKNSDKQKKEKTRKKR